jgi:hypothetical protein
MQARAELVQAFRSTFNSPYGKRVLDHLRLFAGIGLNYFSESGKVMAYRAGQASVWNEIEKLLKEKLQDE